MSESRGMAWQGGGGIEQIGGRLDVLVGRGTEEDERLVCGVGSTAPVLYGAGKRRAEFGARVLGGFGDVRGAVEGQ
ncbi:hypothetical protein [Streptomyces plumbiresistens]|uniref:hypothetical protein n=1 Tax=Streptomyces plumbiresistens TaxID=511811 RepID=UPI0031F1BF32